MADKNTWPPVQLQTFTPLLLAHYQDNCTPEQVTTMAELMYTGDIGKVTSVTSGLSASKFYPKLDSDNKLQKILDSGTVTKEIRDILVPLENSRGPGFVLIEGAPGIGKSVLLLTSGPRQKYYKSLN